MTPGDIKQGMAVLRNYYVDREGKPHVVNDAQWAVYIDGLAPFSPGQLEAAARAWMRQSRFFPQLSDLLPLIQGPAVSPETAAHLAWTTVERALRAAGAYRGATFVDGAIGETVRQVFGSWAAACQFDIDSPGWAIRRQSFLAVYVTLHHKAIGPVTLPGMHRDATPMVVGHVDGLPALPAADPRGRELSPAEATTALAAVRDRFLARTRTEAR